MNWYKLCRVATALAVALFCARTTHAEEARPQAGTSPAAQQVTQPVSLPANATTQHKAMLAGRQVAYTATAGSISLIGAKREVSAKVFYVSYTVEGQGRRPLTFAFNGGPGSSSAFLHLGAIGPRIVPFTDNGAEPVFPVAIEDNQESWLSFTDLVFVDPVGTGYSRPTKESDADKEFWGVDKDASSVAEFIRMYLAQTGRSLDPVFLAGESYGGFRAALLADRLLAMGIQVKGAVMISPALEFSMLNGDDFNFLPTAFVLPSLAAAHAEMQGGPNGSLESVRNAEAYAKSTYLLHLSDAIKPDPEVTQALAAFTGLDADTIERNHGRVSASLFVREYRRHNDRALSHYDATVSVPLPKPSERNPFDPILDGAVTVMGPAIVTYFAKELEFRTDLEYRVLDHKINAHWDFGTKPTQQGYAGSLDDLQKARTRNPGLKLMIAHGYTDLVTPYSISRYLIGQLDPIETAAVPEVNVYRGGHMMYLRRSSRAELSRDVSRFFEAGNRK